MGDNKHHYLQTLLKSLCNTSIIPNDILNLIFVPYIIVAIASQQRSYSLQQMGTITENHNRTQRRDQQITGSQVTMDLSTSQFLNLLTLREHQGRGAERLRQPEYQEISCKIVSLRNSRINKTKTVALSVKTLTWKKKISRCFTSRQRPTASQ